LRGHSGDVSGWQAELEDRARWSTSCQLQVAAMRLGYGFR